MPHDFYCDQVLSGKTEVHVVRETERVLAFHHTRPTWEFHVVIIPKKHVRVLTDVNDDALLAELLKVAQEIIRKYRFNDSNYKLITNGGTHQSSQHLHFHLVSGRPIDITSPDQLGELQVT